ncbi:MAG TPA: NAD(P)-dependent oxidoreductase [Polyangiaceae bacterium]|nr:NAD(P)-dependent oxidoreductase [Polyangiaceae bacterium]
MGSRVLVIGSQGFVGKALRSLLAERGTNPVGVGAPGTSADFEVDLTLPSYDPEALAERVGAVEGVIYLAARITRGSCVGAEARRNLTVIADAAVRTFEAFHDRYRAHFVFCSSIKVYGPSEQPLGPEVPVLRPEPYSYGSAKALAERLLATSALRSGGQLAVVRPSFIYGPGQRADNAIPIFLSACFAGKAPVVFGHGRELRDDVLVRDVAECLAEACSRRATGVFNATGERSRTLFEVAELCCRAVETVGGPAGLHPVLDPSRPGKAWIDQRFDRTRTDAVLGCRATPLFEGLVEQARWMREQAAGQRGAAP